MSAATIERMEYRSQSGSLLYGSLKQQKAPISRLRYDARWRMDTTTGDIQQRAWDKLRFQNAS